MKKLNNDVLQYLVIQGKMQVTILALLTWVFYGRNLLYYLGVFSPESVIKVHMVISCIVGLLLIVKWYKEDDDSAQE